MTERDKERIKKKAYDYYSIEIYPVNWNILREGYIEGATSENERMTDELFVERQLVKVKQKEKEMLEELLKQERNKAIDEAIELIPAQWDNYMTLSDVIKALKSLKSPYYKSEN